MHLVIVITNRFYFKFVIFFLNQAALLNCCILQKVVYMVNSEVS